MTVVHILNELFGVAWVPVAVILVVGAMDMLTGSFLVYMFMDFIDLDGYATLWDKYRDKERDVFRYERHFAYDNYKDYLRQMLQARNFESARQLRWTMWRMDYLTLYYMEMAWDGDCYAKEWLEKEYEE